MAAEERKYAHVEKFVRNQVLGVQADLGMTDPARSFGYWFLTEIDDLSAEEAEASLTTGPDLGRDAVYMDTDNAVLSIYQFKYSADASYVAKSVSDLQRGLAAEQSRLMETDHDEEFCVSAVRLVIVSLLDDDTLLDEEFRRLETETPNWIRSATGRAGVGVSVDHSGLSRFAQAMEQLVGVDLTLTFNQEPIHFQDALLGLVDLRGFTAHIDREELLSINIRKYLGLGGQVNKKIKAGVADPRDRAEFWKRNNGLVCVCTNAVPGAPTPEGIPYELTTLAVANGGQTTKTVCTYLKANPQAATAPVWAVAKILVLGDNEKLRALEYTVTSNTQNAAGDRDIRGGEQIHEYLADWIARRQQDPMKYIHKRAAGRPPAGTVSMWDLAQAYVAWLGYPEISFSRPAKIFNFDSTPDFYSMVFPSERIEELQFDTSARGLAGRTSFIQDRLAPWALFRHIRTYLRWRAAQDPAYKQWKSVSFHLLWTYGRMLDELSTNDSRFADSEWVFQNAAKLVLGGPNSDQAAGGICDALFRDLHTQLTIYNNNASESDRYVLPRDWKSEVFAQRFLQGSYFKTINYADRKNEIGLIS